MFSKEIAEELMKAHFIVDGRIFVIDKVDPIEVKTEEVTLLGMGNFPADNYRKFRQGRQLGPLKIYLRSLDNEMY